MDFHPLVIHYPIAFLTTYAVFEILRFRKLASLPYWFYLKRALVILGEISAIVALVAAYLSTSTLAGESALGNMYKLFMLVTVLIFGVISGLYLKNRVKPAVLIPLALIGLFFIVVAGGLFGAIVYGTHFNPFLASTFQFLNVY
ncbi:MAG: hypothetical protein Q7R67_02585 [bacterium]|nr:hypothetical protein [bacterium]